MKKNRIMKRLEKEFIQILKNSRRKGVGRLIKFLKSTNFFYSPADKVGHRAFPGALVLHSLNVYHNIVQINRERIMGYKDDTLIIVSLLHDICKVNKFIYDHDRYISLKVIREQGHGVRSEKLIRKFIKISEEEAIAIKYHMGKYSEDCECDKKKIKKHRLLWMLNKADKKAKI